MIGSICGLTILSLIPITETLLQKAGWALLTFVLIASIAGFAVGGRASRLKFPPERCVRRGAWSGLIAVMVAAACLILIARYQDSVGASMRAALIFMTSVMPAVLCAVLAAGGGALLFKPVLNAPPDSSRLPADLPRRIRLVIRGVVATLLAAALLSPLVPKDILPTPTVSRAPVVGETAPAAWVERIPQHYPIPQYLHSTPPTGWVVTHQRELGKIRPDRGLCLSNTGRYLSALDLDGTLVIYDLDSDRVNRVPPLALPILQVSISPDEKRAFVVVEAFPRRVGVIDLTTKNFILLPQPKKHTVPDARVAWWKESEVIFLTNKDNPLGLDLENLEFNPIALPKVDLAGIETSFATNLPKNEKWAFESARALLAAPLPEEEGTPDWQWLTSWQLHLRDEQYATRRVFPEVDTHNSEVLFGTSNGARILRVRNGYLTAFHMGIKTMPPLRWKIAMPHGPELMPDKEAVKSALERKELGLVMYGPLVNPLNDRIIGPDREQPKGVLRVRRWEGQEAEVWMDTGAGSYAAEDILADLHVIGVPPRLLNTRRPHRWWEKWPAHLPDSSDPEKLPLRSELIKIAAKPGKAVAAQMTVMPTEIEPPAAGMEFDDIKMAITNFVIAHHAAASAGRIRDVVNDYADEVDYFDKGKVDRNYIFNDGINYHRRYKSIWETVRGDLSIEMTGEGQAMVGYTLGSEWQRLADNVSGQTILRVSLNLKEQPGGWKITRHRAIKQN